MKTTEGDNTEHSDGSIKVWFGNQVEVKQRSQHGDSFVVASVGHHHPLFLCPLKLTPIISDPEYLLDQHILMCVKSTDSDESYGNELTLQFASLVLCSAYSFLLRCSQRRGLCGSASCWDQLHRVSDCTDSPRREDRHTDRWHSATHLRGQAHWEAIWWGWTSALGGFNFFQLKFFKLHSYFVVSDFIKIERDDPVISKGKCCDLNK